MSRPPIVLGVIAAPGPAADLSGELAGDLTAQLGRRYRDVDWRVALVVDGLVTRPRRQPS